MDSFPCVSEARVPGSIPGGSTLSRISSEWDAVRKAAVAGSTPERDSMFGGGAHAMDLCWRLYIAPGQIKRFIRPENVRQLCKVRKVSGRYARLGQRARMKGLLGLTGSGLRHRLADGRLNGRLLQYWPPGQKRPVERERASPGLGQWAGRAESRVRSIRRDILGAALEEQAFSCRAEHDAVSARPTTRRWPCRRLLPCRSRSRSPSRSRACCRSRRSCRWARSWCRAAARPR
jgi:hypothetical protein